MMLAETGNTIARQPASTSHTCFLMSNDYMPASEDGFNDFQETLLPYLMQHSQAWGLTEPQIVPLTIEQTTYRNAWIAARDPATRTPAAIKARQDAHKTYTKLLRNFVAAYLAHNPLVTDEDRINMGLTVHKTTHTPQPVPKTQPGVKITLVSPGRVIVDFFDAANNHHAKARNTHGVEIGTTIRDTAPTTDDDFTKSVFDTHSPYTFDFDLSQRGKTLWIRLRWENNRGEKGPWSEIFSIIIP
jgi:hypothetical protein